KFASVEAHERALRGAQAAQHRAAVEMALDVPARAERDGDAGEHRGEERRQREEALRALDGRAQLRPAGCQRLDALAASQLAFQRALERLHALRLAGAVEVVRDA